MDKKKIFSITMVKNEVDIIEIFIRYHMYLLDGMVILDNGSVDGTQEIIVKLAKEKLPVYLVFDDSIAFVQDEIMSNLLYSVLDKFQPDIIIPLDVDEFITTKTSRDIRQIMEEDICLTNPYYYEWITYVPTENDVLEESNVVKRIMYRRKNQHNHDQKIIIPAELAREYNFKFKQGNHDIIFLDNQNPCFNKKFLDLNLAHYPIRSLDQIRSKCIVGWLANLARPKNYLFDWYSFYNKVKNERNDPLSISDIKEMARYYNVLDKDVPIELIKDPLKTDFIKGIDLKYTNFSEINYFSNLLDYSESLAKKYSKFAYKEKKEATDYDNQIVFQIIHEYLSIEGALKPSEAVLLYKTANNISSKFPIFIEIVEGACFKRSSFILSQSLNIKNKGRFFSFDPSGNLNRDSLSNYGENNKSEIIKSINEVKKFGIDLLFVDCKYDYEKMLSIHKLWSPKINIGGFIAYYNVGSVQSSGPKQVVENHIIGNSTWDEQENHQFVGELYITCKRK